MNSIRAIMQGLDLTGRLFVAVLAFLLVYAFMGALVTVLLPFEMINGHIQVPPPATANEALSRFVLTLGLYFGLIAASVWLMGGVLVAAKEILENKEVPPQEIFRAGTERFSSMFGWAVLYMLICLGAGMAAAFVFGFLAAALGQAAAVKSISMAGFSSVSMAVGLLFLFSPMVVIEKSVSFKTAFGESSRFVQSRGLEIFLLVLGLSILGAIIWWIGVLVLARISGGIREMMGIPPFAKGLPVFFFSLINGLPQAFLSVFLPASLYAYYHGANHGNP